MKTIVPTNTSDLMGPVPAHWLAIVELLVSAKHAVKPVYVPGGQEHGPFLRYVEPQYRGQVASLACQAVRAGAETPIEVIEGLGPIPIS